MTTRQQPPIRRCPICGIAMQARKTRDDIPHFDRFECLNCDTVISEKPPADRNPRHR